MSIVGRAYVTVRAITSGVEKDIQTGIDKQLARVKTDKAGKALGGSIEKDTGKAVGDGDQIGKGVDRQLNKVKPSKDSSDKIGRKIGKDIGSAAGKETGSILARVLKSPVSPALLNQAATEVSGLTAAAVSLSSTLGPVLAGGAGIGANAVLGLGAALGVVKLVFDKHDAAVLKFKSTLGPATGEVDRLRVSLQHKLFPVLSQSANRITLALGPTLRKGLGQTAIAIGNTTKRLAVMAETPIFKARLGTILASNAKALDLWGKAGVTSAGSFLTLAAAAGPLTVRFATFADKVATSTARTLDQAEASGKLEGFFNRAGDTTAKWGTVLANTGKALFHTFDSGTATGQIFLTKLENVTAKWDKWTTSIQGQKALHDWFAQSVPVMEATGRLLGGVAKTFATLSGGAGGLTNTLDFLSGSALPALDSALKVVVPLSSSLLTVFTSISPILNVVAPLLNTTATAINAMPGPLQAVVGGLLLFAVAGDKIQTKLTGMRTKFAGFGTTVKTNVATMRTGLRGVVADMEILASTSLTAGAKTTRALDRSAAASTRLKAKIGSAAKGAAVLGAIAVASSGVAEKMGLAAVSTDAFTGALVGGPLGAGIGALIGTLTEITKAAFNFQSTLHQADDALDSNSAAAQRNALAQLQLKASYLATSNSFGANAQRIWAVATGGQQAMINKSIDLQTNLNLEKNAIGGVGTILTQGYGPKIQQAAADSDNAARATDNFNASLKALNGTLTNTEARIGLRDSIRNLRDVVTQNPKGKGLAIGLGEVGKQGDAVRSALLDIIKNSYTVSTQFKGLDHVRFMRTTRAEIIGMAKELGLPLPKVKALLDQFKIVDETKLSPNTAVMNKKIGESGQKLKGLHAAMEVRPNVDANTKPANDKIATTSKSVKAYDRLMANATLGVIDRASPTIQRIISGIAQIRDKHVTITTTNANVAEATNHPRRTPRDGGWVSGRAGGGWASGPGSPTSDSIPYRNTMISNDEFVVNARQSKKHASLIEAINSGSIDSRPRGGGLAPNITLNITTTAAGRELDEGVNRAMSRINLLMGTG